MATLDSGDQSGIKRVGDVSKPSVPSASKESKSKDMSPTVSDAMTASARMRALESNTLPKPIEADQTVVHQEVRPGSHAPDVPGPGLHTQISNAESSQELVGKVLDSRFRIISRLGQGGMSEVFKAEHLMLQKPLAIKIMHAGEKNKVNGIERFQQEAKAISTLDHPAIVKVHAFGCYGESNLYLAMDYLAGASLDGVLKEQGAMPWLRVREIAKQLAEGLAHAHSRGVIHRDLKPSNVIVLDAADGTVGGKVKIVDFGVARLTEDAGKEMKQLTLAGNTCGSPPYMSPEQCMGQTVDARSDIYSLGVMLYELLTAKRPFYGNSNYEVMQKHIQQSPKRFKTVLPKNDIPPALEAVVRKCLEKDPSFRYQSMDELLQDLELVGSELPQIVPDKSEQRKDDRAALLSFMGENASLLRNALIAIVLLIVAAVLAYGIFQSPEYKISQLKHDYKSISSTDPDRIAKSISLLGQLGAMEAKHGNAQTALLNLQALEAELKRQRTSTPQCHGLVLIARQYRKFGKGSDSQRLFDETIKLLEDFVLVSHQKNNFAQLEEASFEILRICREDDSRTDRMIGQFNTLIPLYIFRKEFAKAESMANLSLQVIRSHPQANATNEIVALMNLTCALEPQSKLLQAERAITSAWELTIKSWEEHSLLARNVGTKLIQIYRAEGKEMEARQIAARIGVEI